MITDDLQIKPEYLIVLDTPGMIRLYVKKPPNDLLFLVVQKM